jgi:GntR family transcriptional repressor for pyruvate dehydrogenase complex
MTGQRNAEEHRDAAFPATKVLRPRQQVEEQIRNAILNGTVRHGDRLPSESVLAEQFSVSRSTVREALGALAERGFIRRTPGARGGSFVEFVDHNAVGEALSDRLSTTLELGSLTYDEVAEFRDLLEVPSARLAAINRKEADLDQLHDVIEAEKKIAVGDPIGPGLNQEFHVVIARASGNRLLLTFVDQLHTLTHPARHINWSPEIGKEAVKHHINITRAIRQSDPVAAADAMRNHLDFLRDNSY